jgi:hypothetical protein
MHERPNPGLPPERPPAIVEPLAPGTDATVPPAGGAPLGDPRALQILTTEHWSLLATRSLAYNEAFTRAGMFLTALSASMVAIAFVYQADKTGDAVRVFTLVLLAFDLLVGLTTYLRLIETTREDLRCVQGMNRLRHAYFQIAPGIAPYFVTSDRDDLTGVLMTYEGPAREDITMSQLPFSSIIHGFSTNTGMVGIVVALVGGSLAGVAIAQLNVSMIAIVAVGAAVFVILMAVLARLSISSLKDFEDSAPVLFPGDKP